MKASKPVDLSAFRHLYPFQSHYLDLHGLKMHYLDEGKGNPVVMVHGNPTWSFYFRCLVKALSSEYRVVVPDHIGCGLSEKPRDGEYGFRLKDRIDDLTTLLDHLGLKRNITLIVHDWGGAIGLGYAVRRPESISRLIILNTAAFYPPDFKNIPLRLTLIRNFRGFASPVVLGLNGFARGAVYMAARKKLPADVKAGLLAPYNSVQNRLATLRFVEDIPLGPGDPSYGPLMEISEKLHLFQDRPILICWGGRDFVFNDKFLAEWQRRYPEAEVHYLARAGHYLLEDEPEKVTSLVQKFLAGHALPC